MRVLLEELLEIALACPGAVENVLQFLVLLSQEATELVGKVREESVCRYKEAGATLLARVPRSALQTTR